MSEIGGLQQIPTARLPLYQRCCLFPRFAAKQEQAQAGICTIMARQWVRQRLKARCYLTTASFGCRYPCHGKVWEACGDFVSSAMHGSEPSRIRCVKLSPCGTAPGARSLTISSHALLNATGSLET